MRLDYRCALYRAGLRLDLATDRGDWLRASVRLKAPVCVQVAEEIAVMEGARRFAPWALDLQHVSFLAPASGHTDYEAASEDPFFRAFAFARKTTRNLTRQDDAAAELNLEQLRFLLATAVRAAVVRCQPAAFAVARRFHPLVRLFVYRAVAGDVTGRIAELARACPGVLVFAAGLESCRGIARDASRGLLQDVVSGRPLARLLSDAVQQFLIYEAGQDEQRRARGARAAPTLDVMDGPREALERWVDRLRLLVRRAGPRVSPLDLCVPPPQLFAAEDIPVEVRANARWYAAMRFAGHVIEADLPAGSWSFLSRNAVLLHDAALSLAEEPWFARIAGEGLLLGRTLFAYGRATGRWPTRHTNGRALLASAQSWWLLQESLTGPAQRLGELLERLRKLDLGEVEAILPLSEDATWDPVAGVIFPAFEVRIPEVAGVELRPITTALELAAEGRRMRNCVAGFCGELAQGGRWILSGRVLGEPVTVEISRIDGRHALADARGYMNRKLSKAEWLLLRRWVGALDAPVKGKAASPQGPA